MRSSFVLAMAALSMSCSITGVRASGTVPGQPFESSFATGTYCEHCAGGVLVTVVLARHPATVVDQRHDRLSVEFPTCMPGKYSMDSDDPYGARVDYLPAEGHPGLSEADSHCVQGEVNVEQCSSTHVRFRFSCRFRDGSHVEGAVATALDHDLGYD